MQQQYQDSFQSMTKAQHEDSGDSYTEYSNESITQVKGIHGQEKKGRGFVKR
jgi:hypothetical protein